MSDTTLPTAYEPGKSPIIRNLVPGLVEVGKIKIGRKGRMVRDSFRVPEKLDHFLITTLARDREENFVLDAELMTRLMDAQKPRADKLTQIPVRLLFDEIPLSFQCRLTCFRGRTRWCTGDGVAAFRLADDGKSQKQIQCPCERAKPEYPGEDGKGKGKCKTAGCLSVLIEGAECVGGVWKFRTTSYNSVVGILSALTLIKRITGGQLAGIPLLMTVRARAATNPVDQSQVTIYVVNVEYRGTVDALATLGYKIALANATLKQQIAHVEQEALRLISVDAAVVDDDGDAADEFFPEDAAGSAPIESNMPPMAAPAAPSSAGSPAPAPTAAAAVPPAAAPEPAPARRGRKPKSEPKQQQAAEAAPPTAAVPSSPPPEPAAAPAAPDEPPEPAPDEPPPPMLEPPPRDLNFF